MKLIFVDEFIFYTSSIYEVCIHCHWLGFSSFILNFGQCVIPFYLIAVKENNWARSFQTMKGTYATKGNQWVSYNDVQFVKEKADYVIKNKYGGVAVFTMDMDDFNNNCCQVRFLEFTVRRK